MAVEVEDGRCDNGALIQQYENNHDINKKWGIETIKWNDDIHFFSFIHKKSGKLIDVPSQSKNIDVKLNLWEGNATIAQVFMLLDVNKLNDIFTPPFELKDKDCQERSDLK